MNLVCYPVLNGAAGHTYSVQPGLGFMSDSYFNIRKAVHSGTDWNATTGGNTDYGDPVYATQDYGVVRDTGTYRGWGKDVMVVFPSLAPNTYNEDMYAHLSRIVVVVGQKLRFGDLIGYIGRGWLEQFTAHLHFEKRIKRIAPQDWPSSLHSDRTKAEAYCRATRIDAEAFMIRNKAIKTLAQLNKVRASLKLPPVSGFRAA